MPVEERPRERLVKFGAAACSDIELLALLLLTGTRGINVLDLARHLLTQFKSLSALSRCSVKELTAIKGIGPAKAVDLAAAFALGNRLAKEAISKSKIDTPE